VDPLRFAQFCISMDDPAALQWAIDMDPSITTRPGLLYQAASGNFLECLRYLFASGAAWSPNNLVDPAKFNHLSVLEVVLQHTKEWDPRVPGAAGLHGRVRFLMRIFEAGCPVWTAARDGELGTCCTDFIPRGRVRGTHLPDWGLVVPSDLLLSGPVLLLAAQMGVPLTDRMEGMLGEVRARAQALAGCFNRAARLSREPGPAAASWAAMGKVPIEVIQEIATIAKLSIVACDWVQ
jgi:hypothetical protein